jgi:hypothetical protein
MKHCAKVHKSQKVETMHNKYEEKNAETQLK